MCLGRAVPLEIPAKGMKATQYCERIAQFLTAVEPQKSDTLRTHQQAAAIPQQIVEKSDLDSISALRQNNLVPHEGGLVFCTCAPKGGERNVMGGVQSNKSIILSTGTQVLDEH